jgi:hypothetical protein
MDKPACEALAPLLGRLYAAELRRRIQSAIVALSPFVSHRRLENLAGLSAGYLIEDAAARPMAEPLPARSTTA